MGMNVAVVGAGIMGLSTAWALAAGVTGSAFTTSTRFPIRSAPRSISTA